MMRQLFSVTVDTALCTITRSQPAEHSSGQAPTFLELIMMALRFRARAAGTWKENAAAGGESRPPFSTGPFAWARATEGAGVPLAAADARPGARVALAVCSQHAARPRGAGDGPGEHAAPKPTRVK